MTWLTEAQSRAQAARLKWHLEQHGVKVSIELQRGSGSSRYWGHDLFESEMSHHIVSARSSGLTPGLALVKRGRPDVPPPLCNGYGGFDLVYRIICMGLANHPGAGGPITVGGVTIPLDQGRYYIWGTEYEGGIREADWTPTFRDFMARSNAGIIDWLGELRGRRVPDSVHLEHSTWARPAGRKIDRLGYSRDLGIREIQSVREGQIDLTLLAAPVRDIQERLQVLDFYDGPVDGDYGPNTTAAVTAYQSKHDLHVDGVWGPNTEQHYQETLMPIRLDPADIDTIVNQTAGRVLGDVHPKAPSTDLRGRLVETDRGVQRLEAAVGQVFAAVTGDDTTPEEVAAQVVAALSGTIRDAVVTALTESTQASAEETADAVVERIGAALRKEEVTAP